MKLGAVEKKATPDAQAPWWQQLATTAVSAYQQNLIIKENIRREREGLPPVDPSVAAAQVKLSADAAQIKTAGIALGAATLVIVGAVLFSKGRR